MRRKKPLKKDITQSNVIEVINREGKKLGVAELIRRKPSHYIQDNLPFIMWEKNNRVQDSTTLIWAGERWEVEWKEHDYYKKGDHTCLEVCYFIRSCSQYPSFSEPEYSEHDTNGRYIFLEENGVLLTENEYNPLSVKALKRVIKKFRGELVVYAHSPHKVKERFELSKVGHRIIEFLDTNETFEDAVFEYLYKNKEIVEDYLLLAGESQIDKKKLKNSIQCGNHGLKTT